MRNKLLLFAFIGAIALPGCEKDENQMPPTEDEVVEVPANETVAKELDGFYTAYSIELDGVENLNVEGGYTNVTFEFDYTSRHTGDFKWVLTYQEGRQIFEGNYFVDQDNTDNIRFKSHEWQTDAGLADYFNFELRITSDYSGNLKFVGTIGEEEQQLRMMTRKE